MTDTENKAPQQGLDSSVFALAEKLAELRETKAYAEQELKEINAEIEQVDLQLSDLMVETETQNFTHHGTMFSLRTTTRASAVAGHKDELFEALRSQGFGDMVYETVNANSLSAFVKEQTAESGDALPSWLEGLVNVFDKTTVAVRNAAKK